MGNDAEPQGPATDPRVYLAAERTLLAWMRTGLAMMGFGFVVARFGLFLREIAAVRNASLPARPGLSLWVGTTLVLLGVAANLGAAVRHWHTVRRLDRGEPLRFHRLSLGAIVSLLLAVLGLVVAGYLIYGLLATSVVAGEPAVAISAAKREDDGILVHQVRSPYQAGATSVRVLVPDRLVEGRQYPVVYMLPVEKGTESRYGDGLLEVKRHDLHNRREAIFVAPTFSHIPWYADHPTDPSIRQESHFLKAVVPFVEKTYPVLARREGRLLLGFSKSGWGAWSLLLRHPDDFGRAFAWDAPLTMDRPGNYGSGEIFGTQENFERYRIADLLRSNAEKLGDAPRLILTGYGNFREQHQKTRALLQDLKIEHVYRDGPERKHDWHSGWVSEAVELMFERP